MAFPLGWKRCCPLVIARSKIYASILNNFPIYIPASCLPAEMVTLAGTNAAQSDGGDIRFSLDPGGSVQLPVDVAVWSQNAVAANAKAGLWVKHPALTGNFDNNVIYVWYKAATTQSADGFNGPYGYESVWGSLADPTVSGVWDLAPRYQLVYHFGDGSSLSLSDPTPNGFTGSGVNTPTAAAGQVNGAVSLASASSQYVNAGSHVELCPINVSLSAWVKATSFPNAYNTIIARSNGTNYFALYVKSTGKLAAYVSGSGGAVAIDPGNAALSTGTWYHVAMVYTPGRGLFVYINGALDASAAENGPIPFFSSNTLIGADPNTAGRYWNGLIDEVRISNLDLTPAWIATEYANQSDPATFVLPGTPYSPGAYATPGGFYGGR